MTLLCQASVVTVGATVSQYVTDTKPSTCPQLEETGGKTALRQDPATASLRCFLSGFSKYYFSLLKKYTNNKTRCTSRLLPNSAHSPKRACQQAPNSFATPGHCDPYTGHSRKLMENGIKSSVCFGADYFYPCVREGPAVVSGPPGALAIQDISPLHRGRNVSGARGAAGSSPWALLKAAPCDLTRSAPPSSRATLPERGEQHPGVQPGSTPLARCSS